MKIYIMQALIVCPCSDNLVYYIAVISKGPLIILQMLISTTECKEGMWTGRPDLGYWCNQEKPEILSKWQKPWSSLLYINCQLFTRVT